MLQLNSTNRREYNLKEVAAILKCSEGAVRQLNYRGVLKPHKRTGGSRCYYYHEDIIAYLNGHS